MTDTDIALDDLLVAREAIIARMVQGMPDAHRRFLIGFKRGKPDWTLLDIAGAEQLPAVQWKPLNLSKLETAKREALAARVKAILYPV
jgi:hypothetical protein